MHPPRRPRSFLMNPIRLALAVVLLAALALRLYGLNWDQGQSLHPDERFIVDYIMIGRIHLEWPLPLSDLLNPSISGLNPRSDDPETGNPRSFAYGTLPLFVTEVAAEAMTRLTGDDWHWRDRVYLLGRFFSAVLDTGTVLITYFIGRHLASRRVALLAAVVAALAPMSIQLAHFFTTDSWLTFFVALCLLWSIDAAKKASPRWFAAAGAALGLSLATKGSVFALAAVIGVAILIDAYFRWNDSQDAWSVVAAIPKHAGLAALAALAAFALFEPYALVRPGPFWSSFQEQADIHRGYFDVPYTRQYVGTIPGMYHAEQLVRWGFGPVAGLLSLIGLVVLTLRLRSRGVVTALILLAWLGAYGVVILLPESKFIRYLAPLVPVFAISAALALDVLWSQISRVAGRVPAAAVGLTLLAGMAVWTLAFTAIYSAQQTRIAASEWIYANAASGSIFSAFTWDDALPLGLAPGMTIEDRQYQIVPIDLYESGPTYHDLLLLGNALSVNERTAAAGQALLDREFALAAEELRNLEDAGPLEDLDALASELEAASETMSQIGSDLRFAASTVAEAVGGAGTGFPDGYWSLLADAVELTALNATSNKLYDRLRYVDYIVISSNRIPAGIRNMPWRYPIQIRLLDLLESGELGYDLVYEVTNYPRIGPVAVPDDAADEAWLNYDHPHVWIYEREDFPTRQAFDIAFAEANAQSVSATRYPPDQPLMLDQPVESLPVVADGRWSASVTSNSAVALGVWLILLLILQVVGWPLASLLLGRFADGGWGFSRLITILVAAYVMWIAASLEALSFRAPWCAASVLIVAAVGWIPRSRWRSARQLWLSRPGRRETAFWAEGVFWGVFLLFLTFRLINPDSWHPVWGGEKPMEFAHLNAILRSAHFTPYDPWFAGGYINYYYYGMYLVAFLFKLTGIPSEIAFNLAQPTVMALLASGTFSVVATLSRDIVRRRGVAVPAGLVGVMMMVGIGNLTAFEGFLDAPAQGIGDRFGYYTWAGSRAIQDVITEFPYFTGLYADLHAHVVALPLTVLLIALAYAMSRDARLFLTGLVRFPSHPIALVLTTGRLGIAALTIGSLSATNAWDVPVYLAMIAVTVFMATRSFRTAVSRIALSAAISGSIAVLAYGLFLPFFLDYVALFGSLGRVRAPTPFGPFFSHFGSLLTITAVGIISLFFATAPRRGPRWLHPLVFATVLASLLLAAEAVKSIETARMAFQTAAVVVTLLIILLAMQFGLRAVQRGRISWQATIVAVGIIGLASVVTGQVVFGLSIALLAAGTLTWCAGSSSAARITGLLAAAAFAIIAGTELVFLADDLASGPAYRMNTVFKFYNQVWVLLSIAAATLATWMACAVLTRERSAAKPDAAILGIVPTSLNDRSPVTEASRWTMGKSSAGVGRAASAWSQAGVLVTALLLAASLFYTPLATGPRLEQRFEGHPDPFTLNSLDWMRYGTLPVETLDGLRVVSFEDDLAAINWFNSEVDGTPVIAEASIGPYRGNGSRFSIATGLPTVIGWARHEYQQRYPEMIAERERDVERLYATGSVGEKLAILDEYDVSYIVVGDLERFWTRDGDPYSTEEGIAAFDEMVGESLRVAFEHGDTTVYQVILEEDR
jgi:YYY domain-containing protein